MDARPIAKDALVAIFPAGKMGFGGKTVGEIEAQAGVVLKGDGEGGGIGAGIELDIFYDLAPGFRKVDAFSVSGSAIVAVCGQGLIVDR